MKAKSFLVLLAFITMLASCSSPAKLGYLRDLEYNTSYPVKKAPELKLRVNDDISINVYSTVDELLAAPFNTEFNSSYVVDYDGNIDFPVVGKIYIEGLTIDQVKEEISHRIITSGYMQEPIVNVRLNNFTVTVLGQTGNGVYDIPNNSVNLLQLLAMTGGTTTASKIRDVMVIRTENDQRIAYSVNLQSKDLFDSPAFNLQQNDIVYVKPLGLEISTTGRTVMSAFQTVFSAITSTISLFWLFSRF